MNIRLIAAATLLLSIAACAKHPTAPEKGDTAPTGPAPNSPANAVERLAWTWGQRDLASYAVLLAADFVFNSTSGTLDTTGSAFRDRPWGREEELMFARYLFVGGGARPPATRVTLSLDEPLQVSPDPRPGREPQWHRLVDTGFQLEAILPDSSGAYPVHVVGNALLYLVRGDSAEIAPEQLAMGVSHDSTLWYMERWDDPSVTPPAPGGGLTLSEFKALFFGSASAHSPGAHVVVARERLTGRSAQAFPPRERRAHWP